MEYLSRWTGVIKRMSQTALVSARVSLAKTKTALAPWLALLDRHRTAVLVGIGVAIILATAIAGPGWLSRMGVVAFAATWLIVAVRALAARATLPSRAFALSLALGVLIAIFVAPIMHRLPNPYGGQGPWYDEFVSIVQLITLLSPAAALLFTNGLYRVTSLADAFLLAFAAGLGFDLTGLILAADGGRAPFQLALLPPFEVRLGSRAAAGYGYWAGLVMLTLAATLRFRQELAKLSRLEGSRWSLAIPVGLTTLVFLWAATESAALYAGAQGTWLAAFLRIGIEGNVTAVVVLLLLVGLSWAEARWAGRLAGEPSSWREEVRSLLDHLLIGNFRRVQKALATLQLREQARIGRAELSLTSDDAALRRLLSVVNAKLQQVEVDQAKAGNAVARGWRDPGLVNPAGWIVLVLVMFLIPKVGFLSGFWSLPLLHATIGTNQITVFTLLLSAILIARFVSSAPRPEPPADPGELVQFHAEKALLALALGLVAFTALHVPPGPLSLHNPVGPITGGLAQPAGSILLLIAVAITGLTLVRTARWQKAPLSERRESVVRQSLAVVSAVVLLWLPLAIHKPTVTALHAWFGPSLKPIFLAIYGRGQDTPAGFATSNTIAVASVLFVGLVVIGAAFLLHAQSRRIERFLVGPETAPGMGSRA